ncbi:MAG: SGNH/GDSL hydrolase family protein [Eubacteriales bacterium]|nr:SGNH/GDSL hydrolase family protein [Eubacteriales bacterium]
MVGRATKLHATTTPMNPNSVVGRNPRTTDEIRRYNLAAVEVAKAHGVEIDDLFSFMEYRDESWYSDYCHYTAAGFIALGEEVAAFIRTKMQK